MTEDNERMVGRDRQKAMSEYNNGAGHWNW